MTRNQSDSFSQSDIENITSVTPAKTLTEPTRQSDGVFVGKDALGNDYRITVEASKYQDKQFTVKFTGHQTRIELSVFGTCDMPAVKKRLARLGYFFKSIS